MMPDGDVPVKLYEEYTQVSDDDGTKRVLLSLENSPQKRALDGTIVTDESNILITTETSKINVSVDSLRKLVDGLEDSIQFNKDI